jgi:hypothetical protein
MGDGHPLWDKKKICVSAAKGASKIFPKNRQVTSLLA